VRDARARSIVRPGREYDEPEDQEDGDERGEEDHAVPWSILRRRVWSAEAAPPLSQSHAEYVTAAFLPRIRKAEALPPHSIPESAAHVLPLHDLLVDLAQAAADHPAEEVEELQ
jgi:hypothetical protein